MMERNGEGWKDRKKMIDVNINNIIYERHLEKYDNVCVCSNGKECKNH